MAAALLEQMLAAKAGSAVMLLSGLGRLWLELGDIDKASTYFDQVATLPGLVDDKSTLARIQCNKAFMAAAAGKYSEAASHFLEAHKQAPSYPAAANNYAVCLLYSGHLNQVRTRNPMAVLIAFRPFLFTTSS